MAVAVTQEKIALFESIFRQPTLQGMLDLSWQDFEHFVGYVFNCAGYEYEHVAEHHFPHGPGFDLNLYHVRNMSKPIARVEVRHFTPGNQVDLNEAMAFIGKLQVAGGIPGFMVTTSDFTPAARTAAADPRARTFLVNGNRLLRYITYIGGSRLAGEYAGAPAAPLDPIEPTILLQGEEVSSKIASQPVQARVLAVANNKGGVAKTTTALNLGFALAEQYQQRVLLVDMDGQWSLTRSLPRPLPKGAPKDALPPADQRFLSDYFRGSATLQELIRPTRFQTLFLVPSHSELLRLDSGSSARPRAEIQFIEDLHALAVNENGERVFDWIILDTPPAQSYFTRLAIAASTSIIIPAHADTYAVQGLNQVLDTTRTMNALTAEVDVWKQRILGAIVTRYKPSKLADGTLGNLRTELGGKGVAVFPFVIPLDEKIEQAHQETAGGKIKHIFKLAKNPSPAALAYDRLAKEVL